MSNPIRFADVVDIPKLQALLSSYTQTLGISSGVIDEVDGTIVADSAWQDACTKFHRAHPASCSRCLQSDALLAGKVKRELSVVTHVCLNGLYDSSAAIIVNGEHVASLHAGQYFTQPPDQDFFRRQAQQFGYDEKAYLEAIARIPVVPEARIAALLGLYAQVAAMLAETGLSRRNEARIAAELAVLNRELEDQVCDRTQDLRQSNAELQASQEQLAITLNSIGDAVVATDSGGRVTMMNPTAEKLTAWSVAEARNRPLSDVFRIVNATSRLPVSDPVQLVMRHGNTVGLANHTVLLARDGSEYQIADSAAPIRNAAGEIFGVVLVFSDVTEKYRVESELQAAEERFRSTFMHIPNPLTIQGPDGILIDCNAAFCKSTGYAREECLGRSTADLKLWLHPEQRLAMLEHLERDGRVDEFELQMVCRNGKLRTLLLSARYIEQGPGARLLFVTRDVTELRKAERDKEESDAHLRAFYELDLVGLAVLAPGVGWLRVNNSLCQMVGYSEQELLKMTTGEPTHPDDREADIVQLRRLLARQIDGFTLEKRLVHKSGRIIPVRVVVRVIRKPDGYVDYVVVMVEDISEQKAAEERIQQLAFSDALTGLPNRRLIQDRVIRAIAGCARSGRSGALMLIDLDNFKLLNDLYGHHVGDMLLQQVADRLLGAVRESDTVARVGGDEFVVLLDDLSEQPQDAASQAKQVGDKILAALGRPYQLADHEHRNTPSIGISLFGSDGSLFDDLFKQADLAMYQAKTAGRNTLRFFDPEMQSIVSNRAILEAELGEGIKSNQFVLYYQPQVLDDGGLVGAEVLIRWLHPQRGMVFPSDFISLAEDTGLIRPIGQWVLEEACRQLAEWAKKPALEHLSLAVNVSAKQLHQDDFAEQVEAVLGRTGANPRRLKLELTESLLVSDTEATVAKMSRLKAKGVSFSLDDFGTGYSSLVYLKRLPLAQLKIDQGFVRDILIDNNDAAIAKTIIALAGSLGLSVIAEGVETEAQRDFLAIHGCRAYQGYLYGRPLQLEAFERFVRRPRCE